MDRQTGKTFRNRLLTAKTALLVIDMQNDFISSEGYLGKKGQNLGVVQKTVPAVKSMIGYFRRKGMKVIYTQTVHHKYTNTENWISRTSQKSLDPSICRNNSWGAEIIAELKPLEDEPVVIKHRYDAFLDTDMQLVLRAAGIENLVIVGTQTNLCIDTTARRAYMMDYVTIVVEDCVSTPEIEFHKPMLDNFQKNFGYVMSSEEVYRHLENAS